jgi:hypothetical protein
MKLASFRAALWSTVGTLAVTLGCTPPGADEDAKIVAIASPSSEDIAEMQAKLQAKGSSETAASSQAVYALWDARLRRAFPELAELEQIRACIKSSDTELILLVTYLVAVAGDRASFLGVVCRSREGSAKNRCRMSSSTQYTLDENVSAHPFSIKDSIPLEEARKTLRAVYQMRFAGRPLSEYPADIGAISRADGAYVLNVRGCDHYGEIRVRPSASGEIEVVSQQIFDQ